MQIDRYIDLQEKLREKRRELLLFCSHPAVITAGVQSKTRHLLLTESQLEARGLPVVPVPRGGGYTAHEPGQVVVYIHMDLQRRNIRIGDLLGFLTGVILSVAKSTWGVDLEYRRDTPGFFLSSGEKVGSMGLSVRRDFTSFGIALNLFNSLESFSPIVPCGLEGVQTGRIPVEPTRLDLRSSFLSAFIGEWQNRFASLSNQSG